jgi:glycosyltransferase involved in cell wall biosynthesis
MPLVSVAISTWNRAHLVGRAIRSALAQTVEDIEVLVVDDGSTDATPDVLAGFDDSRVRRVRHERNHGISRTRNTAIRLARGEWMAFLDDDNEWMPDYLERQLAFAASRPGADVVYCRARVRDARSGAATDREGGLYQGRVFRHLVDGWYPLMSGTLIRMSALSEVGGFDEGLRATEDYDLWMRLAPCTDFAGTTDVLLIRNERHGVQLSRNPEFAARDAATLDRKWRMAITKSCGRMAYRRWHLRFLVWAESCGVERAIETGAGARVAAARCAGRLFRFLPWSAPHFANALALSILGLPGRRWVARGWRYWYRARKTLGFPAAR